MNISSKKSISSIIWNYYSLGLKVLNEHGGYFLTTFIHTALPLIFMPVLTRYLNPSEYANIALFNLLFAITNSLAGSSIPALVSKNFFDQPKDYIAKIVGNSIIVVFSLTVLLCLLLLIFSKLILNFFDLPLLWLIIIPWCSFFYVIYSIGTTVIRNQRKVKTFSYHKIANIFVNILLSLALVVFLNLGWEGRLWGVVLSFAFSSVLIIYYLKKFEYLSFVISSKIIKNALNLLGYLMPNSLQAILISQIGVFFMQYYFSKEILGLYSVGFQVSFFIKLIFTTISMSWTPYIYEQFSKIHLVSKVRIVKSLYLLSFILFASFAFVTLFSDIIIKIFTTPKYYNANVFIPWLSLGFVFNGIFMFIYPILIKLEKQKSINRITLLNIVFMFSVNILLPKYFGYIGIAYAFALAYFLMLVLYIYILQKHYPLPWFFYFKGKYFDEYDFKK